MEKDIDIMYRLVFIPIIFLAGCVQKVNVQPLETLCTNNTDLVECEMIIKIKR